MAAYCSRTDLTNLGIPADAIRSISTDQQDAVIAAVSDEMDGYLGSQYKLPLLNWGQDVRLMCARLAIYALMAARGFNPDNPGDTQIQDAHGIAERWLKRVSDGSLALTVTDSSNQGPGFVTGGYQILSNQQRGYKSDGIHHGGAFTGRRR